MSSTEDAHVTDAPAGVAPGQIVRWKTLLPAGVSVGLVAFLVWKISPTKLAYAAASLPWQPLVIASAGLVLALYLWDAVCIRWLFRGPQRPLSYSDALRARGASYLFSALNYEVGQGMLAWSVARRQCIAVLTALGYCLLLAYHDLGVLLSFGLIGALQSDDPLALPLRWFCGISLVAVIGLAVLSWRLPATWRAHLARTRWGAWMESWSWSRSLQLCVLRGAYYLLLLSYAAAGLSICGIAVGLQVVCSVIPIVLLTDGLPISVSGLGTREATLLYLLHPDEPQTLLAFSLVWSSALVLGRLTIGLVHWWAALDIRHSTFDIRH
ncbi:MAG TPA: hypothetical protein VGY58_22835 [Gemmataceae bacterium]|jgi:hypothetical protein|nr:hypothetical protein [Gemmataceae bacterium]